MLCSLDDNGIMTGFDFTIKHFVPILDLKINYPRNFREIWVVGVSDAELLAIELGSDLNQPHLKMKSCYRRIKLQIPLVGIKTAKPNSHIHLNGQHLLAKLTVNHESYRRDTWEPLKNFRGRYDSSKVYSDSILEDKEITEKKKDLDKLTLQ